MQSPQDVGTFRIGARRPDRASLLFDLQHERIFQCVSVAGRDNPADNGAELESDRADILSFEVDDLDPKRGAWIPSSPQIDGRVRVIAGQGMIGRESHRDGAGRHALQGKSAISIA